VREVQPRRLWRGVSLNESVPRVMRSWRQSDRYSLYETLEIEVSKLPQALRPAVMLTTDAQLNKIRTKEARNELARREKVREEHVKAGRAMYVFRTEGYGNRTIWWLHRVPERRVSKKQGSGYDEGRPCQSRNEGIAIAQMILVHNDEGGVIYAEPSGFSFDKDPAVIDIRPSTCEYLAKHGKHDWFYVPTGDDVCRSCGLVE
jgi:hypothetical protein